MVKAVATVTAWADERTRETKTRLREVGAALAEVTVGCRLDMHEPDNEGVTARVVGEQLDNALGASIGAEAILAGYQELVVVITQAQDEHPPVVRALNLADILALARIGATALVAEVTDQHGRVLVETMFDIREGTRNLFSRRTETRARRVALKQSESRDHEVVVVRREVWALKDKTLVTDESVVTSFWSGRETT